MRVGDSLYCIKDVIGYDIGGSYLIHSKGLIFKITKVDNKVIYISNPTGVYNEVNSYFIDTIHEYFITTSELRKQKLEKINNR